MLVLDTNTLIYFFKGAVQVASHLYACDPLDIAIPSVVLYELYVGIQKSTHPEKRIAQLTTLLTQVRVLSFDSQTAELAAKIRVLLESQGTPLVLMIFRSLVRLWPITQLSSLTILKNLIEFVG